MDKQLLRITLYATVIYLIGGTLPPAGAVTEPSWGNGTHFCGVSDYHPLWHHHSKRRDNQNYTRPFAANLNVSEPRTVRMIYFLPNDRPYRPDVVQKMKDEIRTVQTFFAEQMEAHGYGRRTFRVERDTQGEPIVHRMDGRHPDSHYLDDTHVVYDELTEAFNHDVNIYLTVIDISTEQVDRTWAGTGARWGKQGGQALVANFWGWYVVAHELGHAFGLLHDFRDGEYIMSYGHLAGFERWRLSACHAENLSVHPYFNPNIPIEEGDRPYAELISPHSYPSDSKSVSIRVRVSDPDGLHQVILHAIQPDNRSTVKQCRGLEGRNERVIEFDYDGVIPSSHDSAYSRSTSLLSPLVHPILVDVVDAKGDVGNTGIFLLFSEALEPLTKISGDNQHGLPNTVLPAPFVVEVSNLDDGFPLFEVPISFTVTAGGGSLSVLHTETDRRGRAESVLTLGPNLGTNTVTVSAAGIEGTVTFTAVATAPVKILDLNLRAAIEAELKVPPNTPIAPAAMATLTGLNAPNSNISDLTGLEHATSLRELYLWDNNITDISPLAGLTNLFALSLWDNNISDISVVAGLTNLAELSLGGNSVTDVSPVMGLTNLTSLHLPGNDISDISSVAGLVNLTYLNLNRTNISDISPVAGLTHLTDLYLGENNITDISHLTGLTDLRLLWLQHTNISDLSALVANTGLGSGDEVHVRGNPLSYQSIYVHIPTLQRRGVTVAFDDTAAKPPDVNGDGNVDVLDLLVIASELGNEGTNIAADVDGNGVVDILDLALVAGTFEGTAAAPSADSQIPEIITAVEVRQWLAEAGSLEMRDPIIKRGIMMLEQLLLSLTPTETVLLANYPNPFNPETWIPYQLAEPADMKLTIYDTNAIEVRQLDLGYQLAGYYTDKTKAAYWDGRNGAGEQVASGVYFYHLNTGSYSATRKMIILK